MVDYTEERAFRGAGGFELLKGKKFVTITPFTSPTYGEIDTQTKEGFSGVQQLKLKPKKSMKPFPTFEDVEKATKKEERAWKSKGKR